MEWLLLGRRKRGRSRRACCQDVREVMAARGRSDINWRNRRLWWLESRYSNNYSKNYSPCCWKNGEIHVNLGAYLGCHINKNWNDSQEIWRKIEEARAAFASLLPPQYSSSLIDEYYNATCFPLCFLTYDFDRRDGEGQAFVRI